MRMLPHGIMFWSVVKPAVPVVGDVGLSVDGPVGVPTADGLWLIIPIVEGDALGVGSTSKGLTPALPISTDPSGIPGRETPLGEIEGADALEDAMPLEADPHVAALPGNVVPPS